MRVLLCMILRQCMVKPECITGDFWVVSACSNVHLVFLALEAFTKSIVLF